MAWDPSVVPIRVGSTYVKFRIPDFNAAMGLVLPMLQHNLITYNWDHRTRRKFKSGQFYTHNLNSRILRIPKGYLSELLQRLEEGGIRFDLQPEPLIKPRSIDFQMKEGISPREHQIGPIAFVCKDNPCQRALQLQTGAGKSFISLCGIAHFKMATIIICSGLMDRWVLEFENMTNCEDVYLIKGFDSIQQITKPGVDWKPDVFVASLETMRLYSRCAENYQTLPYSYDGFLEHFGIGLKIVDEAHECHEAIAVMDLFSRVQQNIYLSATFRRTNPQDAKIFDRMYPNSIRYDEGERERYTHTYFYGFVSNVPEQKTVNKHGYNHAKFEAYFIKRKTRLDWFARGVVRTLLEIHYNRVKKDGEKALIFVKTTQLADLLLIILSNEFPDLKIITFQGNDDDEVALADDVDVIISNPKKCGRGKDIPGLRTVINTVMQGSRNANEQLFGRLRKMKDGTTPIYIQLHDTTSSVHRRYLESQIPLFDELSVTCDFRNI